MHWGISAGRVRLAMFSGLKIMVQLIGFAMPWRLRRLLLAKALRYTIDPTARIGFSILLADTAEIGARASIGHLNYIGALDRLVLGEEAQIGRYNWIVGLSRRLNSPFFKSRTTRRSDLVLGRGSNIANWHLIDCTDAVEFGEFSGLAGSRSQIVTHGVDIIRMKQTCAPVIIGSNSMLATGVIVMKGVTITSCCIVGAGSVVTKSIRESHTMFAGNPAQFVRNLPRDAKYFSRTESVIY
jgi:acetyltransferase-like isoleucine patch superfamily enzyme